MSPKDITLGIIGAGRIGKVHAENIARGLAGARLSAVADVNPTAAHELAERFNVPLVTADYRKLLEDPAIQAVIICSATNTHSQIIQEAAARGKHIFCEKPIDIDLGRIRLALDAVRKSGVKLQIGFNRRFDPGFARARELVAAGQIGTPHILRITSRDPAPPPIDYIRVSGGLLLDMTIHDFDMARFLTGSEATEIFAVGHAVIDPEIGRAGDIDTCIVTMRLKNGVLATIDNSRQAVYGYDQRVEIFGSAGMVAVSNRPTDHHIIANVEGVHSAKPQHFFLDRYRESYLAEMQAFIDCILNDTSPPVTGADGLAPIIMGLAAKKSLQENRPVRLSEMRT